MNISVQIFRVNVNSRQKKNLEYARAVFGGRWKDLSIRHGSYMKADLQPIYFTSAMGIQREE
jgi:hypothetical protein